MTSEPITPFLRWAGSKRRLLSRLSVYWTDDANRYVEPFAGSAALFFAIGPKNALLSDVNSELIEVFTLVRDEARSVYEHLGQFSLGRESYYTLRATNPRRLNPVARAARFIFLNRFCFNGLYRTNTSGVFNVPYAPTGTGNLPSWPQFQSASRLLSGAELIHGDFEAVLLNNVSVHDFVYLDPPYAVGNRRVFRQYGPETFGIADLERLSSVLDEIHRRRAKFVLSYAWCREATLAFRKWATKRVYIQRNIAGFARHRRRAAELIVSNVSLSQGTERR